MILDLFAGPGGWDVAARQLGLDPLGIEMDDAACATREAAGLLTWQGDVAQFLDADHPVDVTGHVEGLIASPPCQTFSMAGKGAGRQALEQVLLGVKRVATGEPIPYDEYDDIRTGLVLEPLRYALELEPDWICWEQVPTVQPVWDACAEVLREDGYSVWTGVLHAEQYGVPQTRKRAVLIASRTKTIDGPPPPTHSRFYSRNRTKLDDGVQKWVSMAEALGWGMTQRPSMTVTGGGTATGGAEPFGNAARQGMEREAIEGRWQMASGTRPNAARRGVDEPAPAFAFGHDAASYVWVPEEIPTEQIPEWKRITGMLSAGAVSRQNAKGGVRVTVQEAAVLQSFPPDYPWDGLATAPHVSQGLPVEDDLTLANELIGDGLQRGVHLSVLGATGKDNEVLQAVVVLDAVDVVHDLMRLRPGDHAVLRLQGAGSEDVAPVDAEVSSLLPALVRVDRVTVEPPLLPVLGAEAACDGFAFAVQARWLGLVDLPVGGPVVADPLVVHEAEPFGPVGSVAVFDLAYAHVSGYRMAGSSKTKQYQQVGNAIPPLLALAVLRHATDLHLR